MSTRTEASAQTIATAHGHDVIVDSLTTETVQVVARPDGTLQQTVDTEPVRVLRDKAWVDVDASLTNDGAGYFVPEATSVPVRFSSGGGNEIAQIQLPDGSWMTESWPHGVLPSPAVDGATATYPDVLPGVDLRLTATVSGMSEVLVIKSAVAATNPQLHDLAFGIEGASLSSRDNGTTVVHSDEEAESADGIEGLRSSKPHSWDSSSHNSGPDGPGGAELGMPVDAVTDNTSVTLDVGEVVGATGLQYPVYIDPDWTGGNVHAWWINQAYPNQTYVDGGAYTDGVQMAGFVQASWSSDGRDQRARAFWLMNTTNVKGRHILNARFNTTEVYASSCNPRPIELWSVTPMPPGTTWNGAGAYGWNQQLDTQNVAYGYSPSCPKNSVGFSATAAVAAAAAGQADSVTLGLKASNENDTYSWKKFAVNAQLVVTYNSFPSTPSALAFTSPPRSCGTVSVPAYVTGTAPITMAATTTDADAGNVATRFYVSDATGLSTNKLPASIAPSGYLQTPFQSQGPQSVVVPANTFPQGTYAWKAVGSDGTDLSGASAWCYFQVDNSPPALPGVYGRAAGPYTVGQPTTVRFKSNPTDKIAVFAYWWSYSSSVSPTPAVPVISGPALPGCDTGSGPVRYACAAADGTSSTLTIAPVAQTGVLWVASYDAAGNVSQSGALTATPIDYSGTNSAAADNVNVSFSQGHAWPTRDLTPALGSTLADANTTTSGTLTTSMPLILPPTAVVTSLGTTLAGDAASPVLDTAGYVPLNRFYNSSTWIHLELPSPTPPAGYVFEENLGWMLPPAPPGVAPQPGTYPLYRCLQFAGEDFVTPDPDCEWVGSQPTIIGYLWSGPVPAGITPVSIVRCNQGDKTASRDYNWCQGPEYSIGAFASTDPSLAAAPIATSGQAVNTTQSFTASAWLKPTALGANATAMAQAGTVNSGFSLGISTSNLWRFCVQTQSVVTPAVCASGGVATAGTWQFVTGVWDATNQQIRLYVGDTTMPTAVAWRSPQAGDVSANGPLLVGATKLNGATTERWRGQIQYPAIFPGVATKLQRQNLYYQDSPN